MASPPTAPSQSPRIACPRADLRARGSTLTKLQLLGGEFWRALQIFFNSGFMLLQPSQETLDAMLDQARLSNPSTK
jgi:hypothetical protein